jgi:hypothetical protein
MTTATFDELLDGLLADLIEQDPAASNEEIVARAGHWFDETCFRSGMEPSALGRQAFRVFARGRLQRESVDAALRLAGKV